MEATIERVTVTAPDISCGHCVQTVQSAVGALPGVRSVSADATSKKVEIAYDPKAVTLAQIEATMDDEGYPVAK